MEKSERTILDHGKVALLHVMGSDQQVLDAARISYSRNKTKEPTKESDRKLIRYLMRHRHTSVFEMAEVLFYLKVPITVARQLVRHRTANLNEVSGRYSELPQEIYVPEVAQCGPQSTQNNQGRAPVVNEIQSRHAQQSMRFAGEHAYDTYDSLLHVHQVSREISRGVLPLHTYTELYWKCDVHNFLHFVKLRMDTHAQYEIRVMATAMYEVVRPHFPLTCEAWEDYILNAHTFSKLDLALLSRVLRGETPSLADAQTLGHSEREYTEFMAKLSELRTAER
jgi:thymidylate synthase (FAD)